MSFKQKIKELITKSIFVDNIKCFVCDSELDFDSRYCICNQCLKDLPFITGKVCEKCGEPLATLANYCLKCKNHVDRNFDKARAVFLYDKEIRRAIIKLKYYGNKYLAKHLSMFLYDAYITSEFSANVIVPVPMTESSFKKRGYNQTELLCYAFKKHGENVMFDCVQKYRETENQVNLGYADRRQNIEDSFLIKDKMAIKNKDVLIVDDIFTTGATAGEVAKVLKKAGANKIFVLTLCHELPKSEESEN